MATFKHSLSSRPSFLKSVLLSVTINLSVLVFYQSDAFAKCVHSGIEVCSKMSLVSAGAPTWLGRLIGARHCEAVFQDLSTGKKWPAALRVCPNMKQPEYVYIHYACNDTGGSHPDDYEIWHKDECELHPHANLERVQALVKNFEHGMKLEDFKKHRLRPHSMGTGDRQERWLFHAYPGVTLEVPMTNNCDFTQVRNCIYERENYALSGEITVRQEYVEQRECLMWGGKVGKATHRVIECVFDKDPVLVRSMIDEAPFGSLERRMVWDYVKRFFQRDPFD